MVYFDEDTNVLMAMIQPEVQRVVLSFDYLLQAFYSDFKSITKYPDNLTGNGF